jgi:hypothetical protein
MLVFNCSAAACAFFSTKKAGKTVTRVEPSLFADCRSDSDEQGKLLEQWVVHVSTLKRKNLVIAMHVQTRYALVFLDIKKNDFDGFLQRFTQRWLDEMNYFAEYLGCFQHFDYAAREALFRSLHGEAHVCKGSDRSVSAHINQLTEGLRYGFEDPVAEAIEDPASLYKWFNTMLRKTAVKEDYSVPETTMFVHWWGRYRPAGEERSDEQLTSLVEEVRRWAR